MIYPLWRQCQAANNYNRGKCEHPGSWWIDDMKFCGTHRFQAETNYGKTAIYDVKRAERKKAAE